MSHEPFAPVIIRLLQGVVSYDDTKIWNLLMTYQTPVYEYFAQAGIKLYIDETDGYAYLHQPSVDEEGQTIDLPRLTRKTRLSYYQTLLCVLLREFMVEFDASQNESERCIIGQDEIYERMRPFLDAKSDEKRLYERMDSTIRQIRDMGFLKELRKGSREFIVQPILKSKINSDKLAEIRETLKHYGGHDDEQS